MRSAVILPIASVLALLTSTASAAAFDPNAYYRLTTVFQGECKSLDVINDATDDKLRLAKSAEVTGQYWSIVDAGGGYYRLTPMFQPTKSLDIVNDASDNKPVLATTANVSGQLWKIAPASDGTYRLTTMWQGTGKSLDIVNDVKDETPILAATGDVSGQHWRITKETDVGTVPASLKLSSFYKKYLDAEGIPIVSSNAVPDAALYRVRYIARQMLARMPLVKAELKKAKVRIAIIADTEVTTNIPEYKVLAKKTADGRDIDDVRGFAATLAIPVSSCAEENVLCYTTDPYDNEDIFVHEFSHTIAMGLEQVYGTDFTNELSSAYAAGKGKFANTYADDNVQEYFAEGVQDWFNLNAESIPSDGIHNYVNTRAELKAADRKLYDLIAKYFPADSNNCSCHAAATAGTLNSPTPKSLGGSASTPKPKHKPKDKPASPRKRIKLPAGKPKLHAPARRRG